MDDLESCTKEELIEKIKKLTSSASNNKRQLEEKSENKKSFDFNKCKFRHVLLKFFYLGWDYHGYVSQEHINNTIEHHIFKALKKTCLIQDRSSANYHRCGRTDKGVSSFSQVISIDLRTISGDSINEINYCTILNRVLPDDIQFVGWCPEVGSEFSARFNCDSRTYKYYFPQSHLNIASMRIGANYLLGTHDFRNLCKMDVGNGVVEFIRNVLSVDISLYQQQTKNEFYSIYVLTICGKAFLWHQIRCIMGILLLIGQGKEKPELILELLDVEKNPRKPDFSMASEIALSLYDCHYNKIEWIYDKNAINAALKKLRRNWTDLSIKASMVKNMIDDLEEKSGEKSECIAGNLIQGVKSKKYTSVMKRQLCDSLEDKIEHFVKRGKITAPITDKI